MTIVQLWPHCFKKAMNAPNLDDTFDAFDFNSLLWKFKVGLLVRTEVECKQHVVQITVFRYWSNNTSTDQMFSTVPGLSSRWDSMIPTATSGWEMSCCISWLSVANTSWDLSCTICTFGTVLNIAPLCYEWSHQVSDARGWLPGQITVTRLVRPPRWSHVYQLR